MPSSTFFCDRYQYSMRELVRLSKNGMKVVVRGYALIQRGVIIYFDRSNHHANKGRAIY